MRQTARGQGAFGGVVGTLLALVLATPASAQAQAPHRDVTVLTRNVFIGTELNPIFAAQTRTRRRPTSP